MRQNIKSAQSKAQGQIKTKKAKKEKTPNEKGKKQNINKKRIDKVEYKTKVNLNKK